MAFPSLLEIIQLSAVGVHIVASVVLFVSLFLWRDIRKSGSRMGFATCALAVNMLMLVEWAIRLRDAETRLRSDGVEVFPPMLVISALVLAASSAGLSMYTRFKCLSVAASIVFWSTFGALGLLFAVITHQIGISVFWWIIGVIGLSLTVLQVFAWTLVPETDQNVRGTKDQRRTDVFAWIMVVAYSAFCVGAAGLVLFGTAMLDVLDSDGVMYAILNLALRSIPLPIVFPILGLFTYWNDITLASDIAA